MAKPKHILHSLSHFLIGLTLTIKGYDKLHHHVLIGSILLIFGIIILIYFFYSLFKKHLNDTLTLIIHWFEAIAALFTAYIFFKDGATYLPYLFLIASIGFFISIYVHYRKHKSSNVQAQ